MVSIRNSSILKFVVLVLIGCSLLTPVTQPTGPADGVSDIIPPVHPSQEPVVKTWHHDCSNTTGFEYMEIPVFSEEQWKYTNTSLESDGQSFPMPSMTNTLQEQDYYGPQYIYTLPDEFPLSGLRNFSVQMELENDIPEYYGIVYVGFLDELYNRVLYAYIEDWFSYESRGGCKWEYTFRNGSDIRYHTTYYAEVYDFDMGYSQHPLEFVNGTWSAWFDPSYGLNGSIPAYVPIPARNDTIAPIAEVETARDIKYIFLMFGGSYPSPYYPLPPFRVHDLYLEYEVGGIIDKTPPSLNDVQDIVYIVGQTGNEIVWNCSDDYPYRYWTIDYEHHYWFTGTNRREGLWNGSPYIVSVDDLPVGERTFLVIFQDKAGFIVWDEVTVTVIEHPLISFLKSYELILGTASFVALAGIIFYWNKRKTSHPIKKPVSTHALA